MSGIFLTLVGAKKPLSFISATGGTETTSGNFKFHTFNNSGTFTVNSVGTGSANSGVIDYIVVAGGGGGGGQKGGGGGAGGVRDITGASVSVAAYTVSV